MQADLTGAEIDAIQDRFATDGDPTHDDVWTLIDYARSAPARLASARQEGYREGVEACAVWLETQAAAFLDARDQHMREATKGSLAEELHSRRACSAEATAASLSEAAAGLRRLSPPPAEPSAPAAEYRARIATLEAENAALRAKLDAPETRDFVEGVRLEAAHQVERWGEAHDREKSAADWFWTIGYLAGKALHADVAGDVEKVLHHTITTAAALSHWHRHTRARALPQGGPDAG